jgi:glucose/arabinose dehydrogenase
MVGKTTVTMEDSMLRTEHALAAAGLIIISATAAFAQAPIQRSAEHDFRVVTVAEGLVNPWSIAFLPGGDMLITERPGRLRIVRNGKLLPDPVAGVPEVFARGQGGLLDVVPHPQFATNRLLYLSFAKPIPGDTTASTTAVVRGRFENDRLASVEQIFEAMTRGRGHYGSRLAFDPRGFLFITVGDRMAPPTGELEAHPAQDFTNHHGTTIRLHDDGRVPTDNPFVGRQDARPEIWSKGHRNLQGLAIHPQTGEVWITEHGPQGGDELNLIKPGANYGWPVIGFGVNYNTGTHIHAGTHKQGMEQPAHFWVPSIGASGLMFYTGDKFPRWQGQLFAGGLVGERVDRITLDGTRVVARETVVRGIGRIRDVRQSPDGFIYLAIDHRQGQPTAVVRLEPVPRS